MIVAILGCLFGILGIFTIGLIFVPLAFLCGLFGLIGGIIRGAWSTALVGAISVLLAIAGVGTSPVSTLIGLGMIGATLKR